MLPVSFPLLVSYQKISPCPQHRMVLRWGIVAPLPTSKWRTTPCRQSVTTYSKYSQLPSISGGCSSIRNPRTRQAASTGTHFSRRMCFTFCKNLQIFREFRSSWTQADVHVKCTLVLSDSNYFKHKVYFINNILKLNILPTQCICVFCMDLIKTVIIFL